MINGEDSVALSAPDRRPAAWRFAQAGRRRQPRRIVAAEWQQPRAERGDRRSFVG